MIYKLLSLVMLEQTYINVGFYKKWIAFLFHCALVFLLKKLIWFDLLSERIKLHSYLSQNHIFATK